MERFERGVMAKCYQESGLNQEVALGLLAIVSGLELGTLWQMASPCTFWTGDRLFGYADKTGHVIWGPAEESPTHPPLFGWTDELNAESCNGIAPSVKSTIDDFFSH
jgi:hypothetical protein